MITRKSLRWGRKPYEGGKGDIGCIHLADNMDCLRQHLSYFAGHHNEKAKSNSSEANKPGEMFFSKTRIL